ncbi:MAG: helix-turn-helix domain-containing protein, partial [Anaerolineae bacterium]
MVIAATPYRAIAHGIRREILDLLRTGSLTAGAIADQFPEVSRPAVSKHLSVLR